MPRTLDGNLCHVTVPGTPLLDILCFVSLLSGEGPHGGATADSEDGHGPGFEARPMDSRLANDRSGASGGFRLAVSA